ncbi:MAG: acyl-CoA thioesterase [Alphaproteobacteria bacterium]|nr:acyl-CoA thioesterase [Alphaproteobacteria bacterium]MBU0793890.1 acyl-CoA thioesterase [Alphaproteobacteria bacterium]MBU0874597.1 acyl-CoA thioesterase [Alphaproteobacteria bacterium]MBU1770376.1 acyl-CoA thioesterase [Alphaproteobacteria bacterium]
MSDKPAQQPDDFSSFLSRPYRIEWGHCDPAGIVYAPRFLEMFGESTIMLFEKALGVRKKDMLGARGVLGFPMVDVSAKFMRSAAYGDDVVLEVEAPDFGNSSFTIRHRLLNAGHVCVSCTEKRVWTVRDTERPGGMRAERVPDDIRAMFTQPQD